MVQDFGRDASVVEARISQASDTERVQAAAVLWAAGDLERLDDILRLVELDWRDALVRAGLENEDWSKKLDLELGDTA